MAAGEEWRSTATMRAAFTAGARAIGHAEQQPKRRRRPARARPEQKPRDERPTANGGQVLVLAPVGRHCTGGSTVAVA
jgi:hypothetical protein